MARTVVCEGAKAPYTIDTLPQLRSGLVLAVEVLHYQ